MSWIATHKPFLGFIVLLAFAFSANALLYGTHAAEEAREIVAAGGAGEHHHNDSGHDDGNDQDASHCCDTHHSHDVTGSDPFVLDSWIPYSELGGSNPTHHLLEVCHERFVPPQHQA